jgi:hypothetical protein
LLSLREEHGLRAFEIRVLRRIFGPKRDEATGEWRKLHSEELNDLYSSPNIIWVIKSRRMTWAGLVARAGEKRDVYRILVGKPEGKTPLGRPRHRWEGDINVGWGGYWLDCSGSGYGQVAGTCKCSNELLGPVKCVEFLDLLRIDWLLKKDSAPWSE